MPANPPPSQEAIERAYRRLRRDAWEGGLEDALAHPIHGKIILAYARDIEAGKTRAAEIKPSNTVVTGLPTGGQYWWQKD